MPLANRRPNVTDSIEFGGERFHISVGINPETGQPCEVFAYGPKVGTQMWAMLQEWCIETSHSLQRGRKPENLAKNAQRDEHGNPMSIFGAAYDLLCEWVQPESEKVDAT